MGGVKVLFETESSGLASGLTSVLLVQGGHLSRGSFISRFQVRTTRERSRALLAPAVSQGQGLEFQRTHVPERVDVGATYSGSLTSQGRLLSPHSRESSQTTVTQYGPPTPTVPPSFRNNFCSGRRTDMPHTPPSPPSPPPPPSASLRAESAASENGTGLGNILKG